MSRAGGSTIDDPAELLTSIETIYDTVLDSTRWTDALDCSAAAAGAFGSMLMVRDPVVDMLQIHVMSSRINAAETATYVDTLLSSDELKWDQALQAVPAMTVLHDDDIWPDREAYEAMPSRQWLRSWHVDHRSAVRLCPHRGWKDTIAFIYPDGRDGMSAAEEQRLAPLLPHLARATEIRRPFTLLKSRYQAILTMLDHLGIGILVVLDDDHILLSNAEAERILDSSEAIRRGPDGRLALPEPQGPRGPSLERSLAGVRSGVSQEGSTVYLSRTGEHAPYIVDVLAFRESGAELGQPLTGALLCMIDPERRGMISTRGLASVYGLTEAEAAVCELMGEGLSNQEIAESRGVVLDTVKAQTKAILRKTLCSNRVELVRRALSIAPPVLDTRGRREDEPT